MALRHIVTVGDSVLTKVSRPVTQFDSRLHLLLDDMVETLLDEMLFALREDADEYEQEFGEAEE